MKKMMVTKIEISFLPQTHQKSSKYGTSYNFQQCRYYEDTEDFK